MRVVLWCIAMYWAAMVWNGSCGVCGQRLASWNSHRWTAQIPFSARARVANVIDQWDEYRSNNFLSVLVNATLCCSPGTTCCGRPAVMLYRFGGVLPQQNEEEKWPQPGGPTMRAPQQMAVEARRNFSQTKDTPPPTPQGGRDTAQRSLIGEFFGTERPRSAREASSRTGATEAGVAQELRARASAVAVASTAALASQPAGSTPLPQPATAPPAITPLLAHPAFPPASTEEEEQNTERMVERYKRTYLRCVEHVSNCAAEKLHERCVALLKSTNISLAEVKQWLQGQGWELRENCQRIVAVVERESSAEFRGGIYTHRVRRRDEVMF